MATPENSNKGPSFANQEIARVALLLCSGLVAIGTIKLSDRLMQPQPGITETRPAVARAFLPELEFAPVEKPTAAAASTVQRPNPVPVNATISPPRASNAREENEQPDLTGNSQCHCSLDSH